MVAVLPNMMLAEQYLSWLMAMARSTAVAGMPFPGAGEGMGMGGGPFGAGAAPSFPRNARPRLSAERTIAEATDNSLMDVPESAF